MSTVVAPYMSQSDGYDCFRRLAQELRIRGLASEADQLLDALASGSTACECLGALGISIRDLRVRHREMDNELSALIEPCVHQVQSAWS